MPEARTPFSKIEKFEAKEALDITSRPATARTAVRMRMFVEEATEIDLFAAKRCGTVPYAGCKKLTRLTPPVKY